MMLITATTGGRLADTLVTATPAAPSAIPKEPKISNGLRPILSTVKIATNHNLAVKKANWIDFDASPTLEGNPLTNELFEYIINVANGEETKNEIHGYREISIFKEGVTL